MSDVVQMRMSAQWAGHMQEAEPGSNWQLGACTPVAAERNVVTLNAANNESESEQFTSDAIYIINCYCTFGIH